MSDERALVIIVKRSLRGGGVCVRCGWPVEVDEAAATAFVVGCQLLCLDCGEELARANPGAFEEPAGQDPP